jgi:hypothetical protein
MGKKYFTVQEADQLIPYLEVDIQQLRDIKQEYMRKAMQLRDLQKQGSTIPASMPQSDPFALEAGLEFLQIEARTVADSIRMKGAELKDVDSGLVDFPAILHGKEVLLCWRMGEARIEFYHGLDDGFRGRRRLTEES